MKYKKHILKFQKNMQTEASRKWMVKSIEASAGKKEFESDPYH